MHNKKMYVVYLHRSPNGKIYIGQTCNIPEKRWKNGLGYKYNKYFFAAIKKYGWEQFTHKIIKENLTFDEANYWECYYIKQYKSFEPEYGYNLTNGGQGTSGHKLSNSTKEKLKLANINRTLSQETKQKISIKCKGRKLSEETKKKMSEASLKLPYNNGAKSRSKKVICIETQQIFDSCRAAGKYFNSSNSVSRSCKNDSLTFHGYHFSYLNDLDKQARLKTFIGALPYTDTSRLISGNIKTAEAIRKQVYCFELNTCFESIGIAAKTANISISNISANLKGRTKYAGKLPNGTELHWRYVNE